MDEDTIIEMSELILAKVETYSEALRLLRAVAHEISLRAYEQKIDHRSGGKEKGWNSQKFCHTMKN